VTEFAKVASHSTVAGGAVLCSDALLLFGCAYDAYIFTASRPPKLLLFWDGTDDDEDDDDDISTRGIRVDRFCTAPPLRIIIRLRTIVDDVPNDDFDPPNPTKVFFRRRVIAQHAWGVMTRISLSVMIHCASLFGGTSNLSELKRDLFFGGKE